MIKRLFLIFLLPLFTLHGCKPELLGEYYLGDLVYTNPYGGYEDLLYLSTQGDSIVFLGNGRHLYTERGYVSVNSDDYYLYQEDNTIFISSDNKYNLSITLKTSRTSSPTINIRLRDFSFENNGYYLSRIYFILPLSNQNLKPDQWYYDSLYVLNRYHNSVFADSATLSEHTEKINICSTHPSILYYNEECGLLKVDFDDSTSWELKEIIP